MKILLKNTTLLLMILAIVSSCQPYENIYDEIEDNKAPLSSDLVIELTEDDYEILADLDNADSTIADFHNFTSEDQAKQYIPLILSEIEPLLGKGSSALVTYHLYAPVRINNAESFTLTEDDYEAIGENFPSLNSESDIYKAVNYLYPNPEEEDLVTLTYDYFASGSTTTRTSKLAFLDNSWKIAYVPTAADYAFMGQAFTNFDSRTTGRARIAVLFNNLYKFNAVGDVRAAVFTYTYVPNGGVRVYEDFLVAYTFDGNSWLAQEDVMPRALQLGHDGETWVPDNTIKYTLTAADYTTVGTWKGLDTPDGGSANQYKNFDRRVGNAAEWDNAELEEGLGYLLNQLFPDAVVGQKYLVTAAIYNGAAGTEDFHLIKGEDGEYTYVE